MEVTLFTNHFHHHQLFKVKSFMVYQWKYTRSHLLQSTPNNIFQVPVQLLLQSPLWTSLHSKYDLIIIGNPSYFMQMISICPNNSVANLLQSMFETQSPTRWDRRTAGRTSTASPPSNWDQRLSQRCHQQVRRSNCLLSDLTPRPVSSQD